MFSAQVNHQTTDPTHTLEVKNLLVSRQSLVDTAFVNRHAGGSLLLRIPKIYH
jgi:hypothetical protein